MKLRPNYSPHKVYDTAAWEIHPDRSVSLHDDIPLTWELKGFQSRQEQHLWACMMQLLFSRSGMLTPQMNGWFTTAQTTPTCVRCVRHATRVALPEILQGVVYYNSQKTTQSQRAHILLRYHFGSFSRCSYPEQLTVHTGTLPLPRKVE